MQKVSSSYQKQKHSKRKLDRLRKKLENIENLNMQRSIYFFLILPLIKQGFQVSCNLPIFLNIPILNIKFHISDDAEQEDVSLEENSHCENDLKGQSEDDSESEDDRGSNDHEKSGCYIDMDWSCEFDRLSNASASEDDKNDTSEKKQRNHIR